MFIFLVGASGVGKSTLAAEYAKATGIRRLEFSATEIARKFGGWSKITADRKLNASVQRAIWRGVVDGINEAVADGRPFIAERSIDKIAYSLLMDQTAGQMVHTQEFDHLCELLRGNRPERGPVRVVHLRPDPVVWAAADESDGGRRAEFLSPEWVWGVDAVIAALLAIERIPHLSLREPIGRAASLDHYVEVGGPG